MPVILQPADYAAWLGAQTKADDLKVLLKPLPKDLMERYRVSRRMGNTRNEGDKCMAPYRGGADFPLVQFDHFFVSIASNNVHFAKDGNQVLRK
jgi:hypothetical protein